MDAGGEVVLVKLGGSLLTEKSRPDTARGEVIERLARELAAVRRDADRRLLVGHGSGSFGHFAASRSGLNRGPVEARQLAGVAVTQARAAALHRLVLQALDAAGCPALSLAPSSFVTAAGGRPAELFDEPVAGALALGLLPVIYGDVVMDRKWGASICSTETLLLALVEPLRRRGLAVRRALWLGETDGLYDSRGDTIPSVTAGEVAGLLEEVEGASGVDVTGGMRHRLETVRALALRGVESRLLNGLTPGVMAAALDGDAAGGTRIAPA